MGGDHCRLQAGMTKFCLNCANIGTGLQQMCCIGVTESAERYPLRDFRPAVERERVSWNSDSWK